MALTLLAKRVHSMPSAPARMAAETVTRISKQHKRNSRPRVAGRRLFTRAMKFSCISSIEALESLRFVGWPRRLRLFGKLLKHTLQIKYQVSSRTSG